MEFLEGGDRKILLWYARHRMVTADFSDIPAMFLNANTPEDVEEILSVKRANQDLHHRAVAPGPRHDPGFP